MDELKDILNKALNQIDNISGNSEQARGHSNRQSQSQLRQTTITGTLPVTPVSAPSSRAEENFRLAFPHFGLPDPANRKRKRPVPAYAIKDTWTHDFFLLSSPLVDKTPSHSEANDLLVAGMGKRRVVFQNKHGDFNHLKVTLEKEFPKLSSQKGAFELLRADRGGTTRPLIPIPMQPNGYGIPYLKNAITSNAVVYIRPIQSELNKDPPTDPIGMTQVFTSKCVNCHKDIPLQDMKKHIEACPGGSSQRGKNESPVPIDNSIVDLTEDKEKPEKTWGDMLGAMFPSSQQEEIKDAVSKALSLNEAAEFLCEEKELEGPYYAKITVQHSSIESLVKTFSSKVEKLNCYTLTIERDELWRGALAFYKKALTDKKILLKDLVIIFRGEEGLDAGAMRVEFFELLLNQIQQRLFEGLESSKVPVRDSTKGFLLKLAGIVISHSIIQGGPAFRVLSPAVYYHLVCADPITVLSHLRKEDIPLNAGTAMLHELLNKFKDGGTISSVLEDDPCSDAYWATINASHWSLTRKVTDADLPFLIQSLIENEILLSRRYELDQFSEGLAVLGLRDVMKQNQELCMQLFCYDSDTILTPDSFVDLIDNKDNVPTDYAQKQAYDWFMKYVQCASPEQLQCLLQFATGFKTVPPYGMEQKIVLKYRPDHDENASFPTSMACLSILSLPTVHSTEKKFKESMDIALKFESQGFGSV